MKKNVLLSILAITLLMAFFTKCKEEDPIETKGNISGTVTEDGSNKAIAAAVITVSGVSQAYKTGDDGKYEITELEEGNYVITASKAGYVTDKKDFTVKATQTTKGDFSLEKEVPKLKIKPDELDFGTETKQMPFAIINENDKTDMDWQITIPDNAEWLSVSKQSGKLKKGEESIVVKVDRSQMTSEKNYTANLVVKSTNGGGSATIKVMANKESSKLNVNPMQLNFDIDKKELTLLIKNTQSAVPMDWTISKPEAATWLSLSSREGKALTTQTESITISVDRTNMEEDQTYSTILTVESTNGGGIARVNVTAKKEGATLVAEPENLEFGTNQTEHNILLSNSIKEGTLNYEASTTESWITIENSKGTISNTETAGVKIKVSREGMSVGKYTGVVLINSNKNKISISVNMEVQAKELPVVMNLSSSNLTHNSVQVRASITSIGSSGVTSHGFCWSTSPNPTINDNNQDLGFATSTKTFDYTIIGLDNDRSYYIRAFAANNEGVSYSNSLSVATFKELKLSEYTKAVELGGKSKVSILSGNGSYNVESSNSTIATAHLSSLDIVINGMSKGTATVTVRDSKTKQTKDISVTVKHNAGSYPDTNKIFVEGGKFIMGSHDDKVPSNSNELPSHEVTLDDYYIGEFEVTNRQYAEFLNAKGNQSEGGHTWINIGASWCQIEEIYGEYKVKAGKDDYPAVGMTWYGAKAYCEWVGGRLPTEAEWEYAARGGNESKDYTYSGSNTLTEVAWFTNNADGHSHEVGQKMANELGIYDMSGNVSEYCSDWYARYTTEAQTNPQGPSTGSQRINRGGGWNIDYEDLHYRVSDRGIIYPTSGDPRLGVRVVFDK